MWTYRRLTRQLNYIEYTEVSTRYYKIEHSVLIKSEAFQGCYGNSTSKYVNLY